MPDFDLLIIGAGPAGYVCAIKAAQLGLKVACADKRKSLGGTCLNVGCIPSKALLHASAEYEKTLHHLAPLGIKTKGASLDLPTMMSHKDGVVKDNANGIDFLFKKNGITKITGSAKFTAQDTVSVDGKKYTADNIVIATGSASAALPNIEIDEKKIVTSTGALCLPKVPKTLAVIGAGAIGLELGSIWRRLGAKVSVIEYTDAPLPEMDGALKSEVRKILEKQGIEFHFSTKVTGAKAGAKGVTFTTQNIDGDEELQHKADVLLVAAGRRPCAQNLGLEDIGVNLDERGRITVDDTFETSIEGIYAIGDVIQGPMLAHKAEEDGVALAQMLAGQNGHVDYNLVPAVVYIEPEVASVGKTEGALKAQGIKYKVGKFNFAANGRARATNQTQGFVKVLTDAATDTLLGVHIIGAGAGEMIATAALALNFEGSAQDIALTCTAHPTLSEALKEACLAAGDGAIHA